MVRFVIIGIVIAVAFTLYALVDAAMTDGARSRGVSKPVWILLIAVLPVVGGLLWFFIGKGAAAVVRPAAPDDDPRFTGNRMSQQDLDSHVRDLEERLRELDNETFPGEDELGGEPGAEGAAGAADAEVAADVQPGADTQSAGGTQPASGAQSSADADADADADAGAGAEAETKLEAKPKAAPTGTGTGTDAAANPTAANPTAANPTAANDADAPGEEGASGGPAGMSNGKTGGPPVGGDSARS